MGTGTSMDTEGSEGERDSLNGQLYVSIKVENRKITGYLVPHVYGSVPLLGSWDLSKALSMERESSSMWQLSFVVPSNHETLDFKFLLKPKYSNAPCFVEEDPSRLLIGGSLKEDARLAVFRLDSDEVAEYRVFVEAARVSPFDLAASWRAYQENFRPSAARGIPDVSINSAPAPLADGENGSSASLELDLEHYVVPAPSTSANSALGYAANMTEDPRSLSSGPGSSSYCFGGDGFPIDRPATAKICYCIYIDDFTWLRKSTLEFNISD